MSIGEQSTSRGLGLQSTGRGGAGNFRSRARGYEGTGPEDYWNTRGRDPIPYGDPSAITPTGRGGRGNIRSPSRDDPPRYEFPGRGYDRELIPATDGAYNTGVHSFGWGGSGNMIGPPLLASSYPPPPTSSYPPPLPTSYPPPPSASYPPPPRSLYSPPPASSLPLLPLPRPFPLPHSVSSHPVLSPQIPTTLPVTPVARVKPKRVRLKIQRPDDKRMTFKKDASKSVSTRSTSTTHPRLQQRAPGLSTGADPTIPRSQPPLSRVAQRWSRP